jgi:hypothetical protein
MENLYSPATADQAQKTAKDAQMLGAEVKKDFAGAARRNLGKATERVTAYADDNTALVAVTAFGVGLLVGHLVSRES